MHLHLSTLNHTLSDTCFITVFQPSSFPSINLYFWCTTKAGNIKTHPLLSDTSAKPSFEFFAVPFIVNGSLLFLHLLGRAAPRSASSSLGRPHPSTRTPASPLLPTIPPSHHPAPVFSCDYSVASSLTSRSCAIPPVTGSFCSVSFSFLFLEICVMYLKFIVS